MATVIERILGYLPQRKASQLPVKNAVIHSGNIDGWLWQGLAGNQDLPNTKYGYALAYLLVPDVRVCVDIYALNIGRLLSLIIQNSTFDPANDETIARSDDVMVRHPYYQSTLWHRRLEKTPYMMKLAYSYILFDEMYVIQQDNEFGKKSGLQVLNPLAMQPVIEGGVIRGYTYSQFQGTRVEIDIEDLAFDHGYNPLDDFRGSSVVMTVIDSINPLRNLVNYINEFFINNARQGMSASFKNSADNNPENYKKIKRAIEDHLKGKGNQFKTFLSMVPLDWQEFENPDIGKQFSIDDPLTKKIYRAFGVPMSLAGDTSGTNYKESKDNLASFINVQALPHILNIQDFQTDSVLSFFVDRDAKGNIDQRFEFDTSRFDILTQEDKLQSEVVGADLSIGLMTVAEAQEARGITRDEDFEDRYMAEGLPVPREVYLNLYKTRFAIADETIPPSDSNGGDDESESTSHDDDNEESEHETDEPDIDADSEDEVEAEKLVRGNYNSETGKIEYEEIVPFAPAQASPEAELSAWRLVALKKWKRGITFGVHWLRGDVADALLETIITCQGSRDVIDAAFKVVAEQIAIKAIQATRLDFELDFEELLRRAREGEMQRVQWASAVRTVMRINGRKVFIDGLTDGGIVEPELSEDDQIVINNLLRDQSKYVTALGDLLFKGDGISDPESVQKPAMWFNKAIMPLYQAGLASADKNGLYEWVVGATDHCDTCFDLNGQRHRMRDYMRKGLMPQSDLLDCNGFNCKCRLVRVFGKARGTW